MKCEKYNLVLWLVILPLTFHWHPMIVGVVQLAWHYTEHDTARSCHKKCKLCENW